MRRWRVVEPGDNNEAITRIVTEEEIIQTYSDYWQTEMLRSGKDPHEFSTEDCIQDWVVVNWAEEVSD